MATIVIKRNHAIIDHVELHQGDTKIGRRTTCDIVLDHLAVSGEHASISIVGDKCFLQDLNSTNGTFVGNKRVTHQPLRPGDAIVIGEYTLIYTNEPMPVSRPLKQGSASTSSSPSSEPSRTAPLPYGKLSTLSGSDAGKRIDLLAEVTHLGQIEKQAGTIKRIAEGYLIQAKHDGEKLRLNGKSVPSAGAMLQSGDVIEVSDTRLRFDNK